MAVIEFDGELKNLGASFLFRLCLHHHKSRVFFPLSISPHLFDLVSCPFSSRYSSFETDLPRYYRSNLSRVRHGKASLNSWMVSHSPLISLQYTSCTPRLSIIGRAAGPYLYLMPWNGCGEGCQSRTKDCVTAAREVSRLSPCRDVLLRFITA